ncbi:MAG: heavy metal translocating P-type ATPase [Candidatus Zipacnadales bacterium]
MAERRVGLDIKGMTCAGCVANVERALLRVNGVLEATVSLPTASAMVRFDDSVTSAESIARAVSAGGYAATLVADKESEEARQRRQAQADAAAERAELWRIGLGVVLTVPVLVMGLGPHVPGMVYVMFALSTAVQVLLGGEFYRSALSAVRHRTTNMDVLIALGATTAYLYSVVLMVINPHAHSYFDAAATLLVIITVGKYLEARATRRTSHALRELAELAAHEASVIRDGTEVRMAVEELQVGDLMVVRPGEKIATDGVVVAGESAVNEALVTGESMPVTKGPGDEVIGGTVNEEGVLWVKATKVGRETALAQIIELVRRAQASKPPIQRIADRVSAVFVPVILGVALLTFLVWMAVGGPAVWGRAIVATISVLVVACPCALGIATPAAVAVGIGLGAEQGILVREAAALEVAQGIEVLMLDKTGTITTGKPQVTDIVAAPAVEQEEVLRVAAGVEAGSEHPLARPIVNAARERGIEPPVVEEFQAVRGRGTQAKLNGMWARVGREEFLRDNGVETRGLRDAQDSLEAQGKTVVMVATGAKALGLIGLADQPKPGSAEALTDLQRRGIEVVMVTGDARLPAELVARQVGIGRVEAGLLPEDKVRIIEAAQQAGRRVAVVGDGVNDAPALIQADVGIAIGSGTDVAVESADLILVSGELEAVVRAIRLSNAMMRHIRQNLFFAFFYNMLAVPVAALGILGAYAPLICAAAMALSDICVVGNALRLRRFKV